MHAVVPHAAAIHGQILEYLKDVVHIPMLLSYSIQEKDFPNTKVKQPGPSRLAGCRARVFLPVYE
jgi:hypothetical protein